ncbi:hypothetical protein DMC30DRAFT_179941, partial [Rhodotorula diobovata]
MSVTILCTPPQILRAPTPTRVRQRTHPQIRHQRPPSSRSCSAPPSKLARPPAAPPPWHVRPVRRQAGAAVRATRATPPARLTMARTSRGRTSTSAPSSGTDCCRVGRQRKATSRASWSTWRGKGGRERGSCARARRRMRKRVRVSLTTQVTPSTSSTPPADSNVGPNPLHPRVQYPPPAPRVQIHWNHHLLHTLDILLLQEPPLELAAPPDWVLLPAPPDGVARSVVLVRKKWAASTYAQVAVASHDV